MALIRLRLPENADGDFYVDSTCIDCDLCRQIAPSSFSSSGDQSAVHRQPVTEEERLAALKALVTCPTASIGTLEKHPLDAALDSFPERIDEEVFFCGFASESSYGASSYLIVRPEGNVLVDSPRFVRSLANRIAEMGGLAMIFLTHRDDVADHARWAEEFGAKRIMHRDDMGHRESMEHVVSGRHNERLAPDLLAIPTPGHTPGHMVLLYRDRYLFSGDHLSWSDSLGTLHASQDVCWYSWPEQIRSMELLLSHSFEWVLPGHGRRKKLSQQQSRAHLERCISLMKRSA